ncbi:MAG: hypothetical protein AAF721_02210 [Myxococcota bacterium]
MAPSGSPNRAWPSLSLLLVLPLLACGSTAQETRDETTIEWEFEQYEAAVNEEFTATVILRNPFGVLDYGTFARSSDEEVVRLVDSGYDMRGQIGDVDGPQDVLWVCAGAGTAIITASHEASDGYVGVETMIEDTAMVTCTEAGTTGTTGDDGYDSTSDDGTTTGDTSSVEDTGEPTGSDESTGGSTGGGGGCAMGDATAPDSRDVTISGVDISALITGDAADCPMLLCTFNVTNNRDDYVTFGVLESSPQDEIAPMPIVSAVPPGESREFEVWANDCVTPITLDRTLFVYDEVAGVSLGDVPLMWQTSLP